MQIDGSWTAVDPVTLAGGGQSWAYANKERDSGSRDEIFMFEWKDLVT